jgi:hypothetical protein
MGLILRFIAMSDIVGMPLSHPVTKTETGRFATIEGVIRGAA